MSYGVEKLDALIWLPRQADPVLAGQVSLDGTKAFFSYDRRYLDHADAVSIYGLDMSRGPQKIPVSADHGLAGALRDALPDLWGRRAIAASFRYREHDPFRDGEIDDATVMMNGGPDRIGSIDFRLPGQGPLMRSRAGANLNELTTLVDLIETDRQVPETLWNFFPFSTSVGGARPKALYTSPRGSKYIAKFGSDKDTYPVVVSEYIAMRLAALAGINVARVEIAKVGLSDILLVERFDRTPLPKGDWGRRAMVSALTLTGESELSAHHITYENIAGIIKDTFENPAAALEEMLTRLIFNILVGNTDDHARNHSFFWDGHLLELTPAYDIAPQRRTTREAGQAMILADGSRAAQLINARAIAPAFGIDSARFDEIVQRLVETIVEHWDEVCDAAGLTRREREAFAGGQFLNEYAFEGLGLAPRLF